MELRARRRRATWPRLAGVTPVEEPCEGWSDVRVQGSHILAGVSQNSVDAIATVEQKANDLLAQADAYRELSSNLAHDDA